MRLVEPSPVPICGGLLAVSAVCGVLSVGTLCASALGGICFEFYMFVVGWRHVFLVLFGGSVLLLLLVLYYC